ncbi:hypothetical protein H4R20_005295 [Coemansia guatemalensis]|uniref:AB hydrolase-1 domain-containing protein n=1 Tax=Coemansia guatemalensis TaxID=2761395 RepID=A0A9W8HX11_9FUNG|nr:hypothetical protein H4R20_005295 [Coemansia guatemalensis]
MASGFVRWKSHVDKLLRFNHMTMTLSAEPFRTADSGAHTRRQQRENVHDQRLAHQSASATATLQYAFDSTLNFPEPFMTDSPRFNSSFEPGLSHLPCVLFLHGDSPGGFDVARWVAGGLSHTHQLHNPLMPSRFGSYSVYNVQERPRVQNRVSAYGDSHGHTVGDEEPPRIARWPAGSTSKHSAQQQPRFAVPMPPLGMLSISRPGYLESSPSPSPTFFAQAATIVRLVESLRIPSVHIIAHSMAAPIALEMAGLAGFRRRVRSISLIDPQLTPPSRARRLAERIGMLGPEWARTRAAYNALARSADDRYFLQAVSEICGTESMAEIKDDPAMARLYEGIGVFFSHWNSRKPGVLADSLMWHKLDRRSWSLVHAPILCITSSARAHCNSTASPDETAAEKEEAARAALVSTRSNAEFARIYGAGRLLFPLAKVSQMCLEFIYRRMGENG